MSLASGRVSGSMTKYRVCISPRKPVPRRSVAGSVPAGQKKKKQIRDEQKRPVLVFVHVEVAELFVFQ